ncbi:hypothetical protein [Streptomyces mayteni]
MWPDPPGTAAPPRAPGPVPPDPVWGPGPPCATALACWSMGGGEAGRQVCHTDCPALDDERG